MNGLLGALVALFASTILGLHAPAPAEDPAILALRNFLVEKGSPIPAEELVKYSNWKMIVALSAAESGYGKYMAGTYNAWGIKDFQSGSPKYGGTRDFASWEESIKFTSELLFKYEPEQGMPKPGVMVATWKYVQPYGHWVNNVAYSLYDIEQNIAVA